MTFLQTRQPKHGFHKYFVDTNTNDLVCLCGKVKGAKKVRGKPAVPGEQKYHNKTSVYNGYGYDSIKEAQYAMVLDDDLKRGVIRGWERQYPIHVYANGQKLFTMKVDFRVWMKDGSFELREVKGYETPEFRLKLKCLDALWLPEHLDHTYVLIK